MGSTQRRCAGRLDVKCHGRPEKGRRESFRTEVFAWYRQLIIAVQQPGVLSAVTRQGSSHIGATSTQPSPQIIRVVISEFL